MEYRRLICELPTEILEIILHAAKTGQYNRAPITLDSIKRELADRAIEKAVCGSDTSQS